MKTKQGKKTYGAVNESKIHDAATSDDPRRGTMRNRLRIPRNGQLWTVTCDGYLALAMEALAGARKAQGAPRSALCRRAMQHLNQALPVGDVRLQTGV